MFHKDVLISAMASADEFPNKDKNNAVLKICDFYDK